MDTNFWRDKKVLVTGGKGFLGQHLLARLKRLGAEFFVPDIKDYDLTREENIKRLFKDFKPQMVIHLAVHGGGIGYMKDHPGTIFYDNILMNTLIIEACRKANVEKFVSIGTVCSYPKFNPTPFKEEGLWDGYPEETNAPYGLAKKMILVQTQAYNQEFGFRGIHLLLANMYGPGDNFNPQSSHVIPALIRKIFEAKVKGEKEIIAWGTGRVSREFLYVEDAAEGIILASERYNKPEPVNLGTGKETTIKELVQLIVKLSGFKGKVVWDRSKPDGQPRRCLDVSKAKEKFGFIAQIDLKKGLRKTIDWYRDEVFPKVGRT